MGSAGGGGGETEDEGGGVPAKHTVRTSFIPDRFLRDLTSTNTSTNLRLLPDGVFRRHRAVIVFCKA
jgi:hypothetical protein